MLAKLDNRKVNRNASPEITFPHAQKSPETKIPRLYSKNRQQILIAYYLLLITYYLLLITYYLLLIIPDMGICNLLEKQKFLSHFLQTSI